MTAPERNSSLLARVVAWVDRQPIGGRTLGGMIAAGVAAVFGVAAVLHGAAGPGTCASDPLKGVYRAQRRLRVVKPLCRHITVTVVAWRHEHDDDWHVNVRADQPGWTNRVNVARQHGLTVIEFVPHMPRPARFYGGQRLRLTVTKVLDVQHGGWIEGHPVFAVEDVTPPVVSPAPNQPALAPRTEEGG